MVGLPPAMSETLIMVHSTDIQEMGLQPAVLNNNVDEDLIATLALVANGGPELEYQIILWPAADLSFRAKFYQEYSYGFIWLQE